MFHSVITESNPCQKSNKKRSSILPGGESNPGLPRDRRGYSPLYYRGFGTGENQKDAQSKRRRSEIKWRFAGLQLTGCGTLKHEERALPSQPGNLFLIHPEPRHSSIVSMPVTPNFKCRINFIVDFSNCSSSFFMISWPVSFLLLLLLLLLLLFQ